MATTYSNEGKNEALRALYGNCDGGQLQVRTGAKNASPDSGATGTLLATFALGTPCTTESTGTATLVDPSNVNAAANGTPGHVRWTKPDGTTGVLEQDAEVGKTFTVNATSNVLTTSTAHSLSNGDLVVLESTGTLPGGLPSLTARYVIGASGSDLQLALTAGGVAIDITDTGSGVHRIYRDGYVRFRADLVAGEPVDAGAFTHTFT